MSGQTTTLESIIADAVEDLHDRWTNYRVEFYRGEPHDVIAEIADSSVPVYTDELMDLAAQNNNLATNEPELGPAFDGSPTPVNIIAANVYEEVSNALFDAWREIKDEDDDEDEVAADA